MYDTTFTFNLLQRTCANSNDLQLRFLQDFHGTTDYRRNGGRKEEGKAPVD